MGETPSSAPAPQGGEQPSQDASKEQPSTVPAKTPVVLPKVILPKAPPAKASSYAKATEIGRAHV